MYAICSNHALRKFYLKNIKLKTLTCFQVPYDASSLLQFVRCARFRPNTSSPTYAVLLSLHDSLLIAHPTSLKWLRIATKFFSFHPNACYKWHLESLQVQNEVYNTTSLRIYRQDYAILTNRFAIQRTFDSTYDSLTHEYCVRQLKPITRLS